MPKYLARFRSINRGTRTSSYQTEYFYIRPPVTNDDPYKIFHHRKNGHEYFITDCDNRAIAERKLVELNNSIRR